MDQPGIGLLDGVLSALRFSLVETGLGVPRPAVLYHYTSPEGLIGIIESQQLRATDVRYLNDPSERIHTRDKAKNLINSVRRVMASKPETVPAGGMAAIEAIIGSMTDSNQTAIWDQALQVFASCFCEEDDLLTQWREYADKGAGFSIGFNTHTLTSKQDAIGLLRRVEYDEHRQDELLTQSLFGHCIAFTEHNAEESAASRCMYSWSLVCEAYSFHFKNHAFASEKEWRIAYRPFLLPKERLLFRTGKYPLVPYIAEDFDKASIKSITVGPTKGRNRAADAVRGLLHRYSYSDEIDVRVSNVPGE